MNKTYECSICGKSFDSDNIVWKNIDSKECPLCEDCLKKTETKKDKKEEDSK